MEALDALAHGSCLPVRFRGAWRLAFAVAARDILARTTALPRARSNSGPCRRLRSLRSPRARLALPVRQGRSRSHRLSRRWTFGSRPHRLLPGGL